MAIGKFGSLNRQSHIDTNQRAAKMADTQKTSGAKKMSVRPLGPGQVGARHSSIFGSRITAQNQRIRENLGNRYHAPHEPVYTESSSMNNAAMGAAIGQMAMQGLMQSLQLGFGIANAVKAGKSPGSQGTKDNSTIQSDVSKMAGAQDSAALSTAISDTEGSVTSLGENKGTAEGELTELKNASSGLKQAVTEAGANVKNLESQITAAKAQGEDTSALETELQNAETKLSEAQKAFEENIDAIATKQKEIENIDKQIKDLNKQIEKYKKNLAKMQESEKKELDGIDKKIQDKQAEYDKLHASIEGSDGTTDTESKDNKKLTALREDKEKLKKRKETLQGLVAAHTTHDS